MRRPRPAVLLLLLLPAILSGLPLLSASAALPARLIRTDVLVVGGTPSGIAAAAAAARAGARVWLVEASPKLGGVITWSWLTTFDMNLTAEGVHLTRGIFQEYYRALGLSFDLTEAVQKLTWEVYREQLVGSTANAPPVRALRDRERIVGVEFDDRDWKRPLTVRARQIIDATDDADLAAMAGASFSLGRPVGDGTTWMQAATLIFRVGGVKWEALEQDLLRRKFAGADPGAWGINGRTAWGYQSVLRQYRPSQPEVAVLGLNMALQNDGSVLINSVQVFGVNGIEPASGEQGYARARKELPLFVAFLRGRIPGFDDAALVDQAPTLYIRETRHLKGLYVLDVPDILGERVFWDRIGLASYPIDIHPYAPGWINPFAPVRRVYTIPFRAMVPVGLDNLTVASRAFSATSEAAGSARVIPTTMTIGQAAGVAAAFCAKKGCTPQQLATSGPLMVQVQQTLTKQGAYLGQDGRP